MNFCNQTGGLGCPPPWKWCSWDRCWCRRKGVIRCPESGELLPQTSSPLPSQARGNPRDGGGALSFYPIVLLAFGTLESCPFIFLDLGALGPYPFIFLTCRTFGLHLFLFLVFSTLFKYLLLLPSEPMGETTPSPPHSLTVRGNTLTSPPFRNTCMCGANAHTSFPENGLGTFL